MRYEDRAGLAQNPLGRQLFELMARKKTNLSGVHWWCATAVCMPVLPRAR